jgi:hypothetical protein
LIPVPQEGHRKDHRSVIQSNPETVLLSASSFWIHYPPYFDLQDHNHTYLDVRPGIMGMLQQIQHSNNSKKPV